MTQQITPAVPIMYSGDLSIVFANLMGNGVEAHQYVDVTVSKCHKFVIEWCIEQ